MIDFGGTLVRAREAKGLTIAQISEMTHMMPQQIEDLENENFSRIAAPIYGRGFVKLYCDAVDIDPKPLVAEFMDIYNGNRKPMIRMKKSAAKPVEPPPPPNEEAPLREEPEEQIESAASLDQFASLAKSPTPAVDRSVPAKEEDTPAIRRAAPSAYSQNSFRLEQESAIFKEPYRDEPLSGADDKAATSPKQGPSRFAPPSPRDEYLIKDKYAFSIPPAFIRLAVLVAGAILAIWLVCALVSKVWRAASSDTRQAPLQEEVLAQSNESAESPEAPENPPDEAPPLKFGPKSSRKPIEVPPLYIY